MRKLSVLASASIGILSGIDKGIIVVFIVAVGVCSENI